MAIICKGIIGRTKNFLHLSHGREINARKSASSGLRRSITRLSICAPLYGISTLASADQFYLITGFECNAKKSEIVVWFRGYQNETGEQALADMKINSFDPRALVSLTKTPDERYSRDTKTIIRSCYLAGNKYSIEISPLLAINYHPEGFCASRIGAKVVVKSKNETIASDGFDACREKGEATTEFVISPRRATTYKRVAARDFFYQSEIRR